MPKTLGNWSLVNFGGGRILELDFTDSLAPGDNLASLTGWSIQVVSGTDPTPTARITTPPTTTGNKTQQKFLSPAVTNPPQTDPIVYILRADILTTNGEPLELWSYLPVVPAGECAPTMGCGTC